MPVGNDLWVKGTVEAVKWAVGAGLPVIASIGMNTWELVLWAIGEYRGDGMVLCPPVSEGEREKWIGKVAEDFRLGSCNLAWVFISQRAKGRGKKSWWEERDRLAFELARFLVPVSVREAGRWDRLLSSFTGDRIVNRDFQVRYSERKESYKGYFRMEEIIRERGRWEYFTHWTRRWYGPWPGEASADYYEAVVSSGDEYPRSAFRTLERIIVEGRIRASGRHIRGGVPAVSFTSLEPCEAIKLMRWRKRYVMPTFEPYGIAVKRGARASQGIFPVRYVQSKDKVEDDEPTLIQGYGKGEWRKEAEWRSVGDFDLSGLES